MDERLFRDALGEVEAWVARRQAVERPLHNDRPDPQTIDDAHHYHRYLIAYGYARTGDRVRAQQLTSDVHAQLAGDDDPWVRYHALAFETRIDQALRGVVPEARLPEECTRQLLARIGSSYDLSGDSRILSPFGAIDQWSGRRLRPPWIAGPRSAVEHVAQLAAALARPVANRADQLHGLMDELVEVPPAECGSLLERAFDLVTTVQERSRGALFARVIAVAEYANRFDLVAESFDRLCAGLANTPKLAEILGWVVPIATRTQLRRELVELVIAAEAVIPPAPNAERTLIAGCKLALGDDAGAQSVLEAARLAVLRRDTGPRPYAIAIGQHPITGALEELAALARDRPVDTLHDREALELVDSIIGAIVGCARRATSPSERPAIVRRTRVPVLAHKIIPERPAPRRRAPISRTHVDVIADALARLQHHVEHTPRERTRQEAPPHLTGAYLRFMFACGWARLENEPTARTCAAEATALITPVLGDIVHAYLRSAYQARVDQALAGVAADVPLSDELRIQLAELDRVARYKADRLREFSELLDPNPASDAMDAWLARRKDSRGYEISELYELLDPAERDQAIEVLLEIATRDAAERDRLLGGLLDVALDLIDSSARTLLERAIPVLRLVAPMNRAELHAKALVIASRLEQQALLPELLTELAAAVNETPPTALAPVLVQTLRALRAIGRVADIGRVLDAAEPVAARDPRALVSRIAVSAGHVACGRWDRAEPVLEHAREIHRTGHIVLPLRLELGRALARAYAEAPVATGIIEIEALAEGFGDISDSYGTNSHYCLSVLAFVEPLILGLVGLAERG